MGRVVETVYGRYNKFQVIETPGGPLSSTSYTIYRDGAFFKGSYSSLRDAVAAAQRAARG